MTFIYVALGVIVLTLVIVRAFFWFDETPVISVRVDRRTPFRLDEMTDTTVTLSSRIDFENPGDQYTTIMDCLARPQLPYEQYDGIEARAKAELEGRPREDDYFESVLVPKKSSLGVFIRVKLTARRGMDIKTAISGMVDLPIDIIYTEVGRRPWRMGKTRVVLTAEEIASLTGVTLTND